MYISGSSITVDVEDLGKRLDAALGKVERTLSKAQKAAGIQIDTTGRLVNAQGKLVEGLTLSQVKLGQYVDELGKLHTENGEFVADLSKIEQNLGFYADKLGDVYNAQGQYIRKTGEARRAMEEQAKAQAQAAAAAQVTTQLTRKAFSDSLRGLAGATQQASALAGILAKSGGASAEIARNFQAVAQGFSIASQTFQGITDFASGVSTAVAQAKDVLGGLGKLSAEAGKGVGELTGAASKLGPALSALGGPIGMTVAGVAAVGAGIAAVYAATSQENYLNETFKEIEKSAKAAGDSIKSMSDALKYGALQAPLNDYERTFKAIEEAAEKLEETRKRAAVEINQSIQTGSAYPGGAGMVLGASIKAASDEAKAQAEQKNAWADYAAEVKKLVDAAREEQKTEFDRLEERKRAFSHILEQIKADEELAKNIDAQNVINEQLVKLDQQIEDAKRKEADEAEKALNEAQARARRDVGIDKYLQQTAEKALELTADAYERAAAEWKERADALGLTSEQIEEALGRYRDAIQTQTKQTLAQELGIDFQAVAPSLTLEQKFERLAKELDAGTLTAQEYANALVKLQDQRGKELEATLAGIKTARTIDAAEKERARIEREATEAARAGRIDETRRAELLAAADSALVEAKKKLTDATRSQLESALGVKFQTPQTFETYDEKVKAARDALNAGTISQQELSAALEQLKKQALAALPNLSKLSAATNASATARETYDATLNEINDALKRRLIDEKKAAELRKQAEAALQTAQAQARSNQRGALGLDSFLAAGEKEKTAREKLAEQMRAFTQAERDGILTADELKKARKSYKFQLDQLKQQEKEAAAQARRQARADQRADLGIDSLLEEMKSPLERWRETMDKAAAALKSGAITAQESLALEDKATRDYWEALQTNAKTTEKAAANLSKFEASRSMTAGSEALYLAQVRNATANYQATMQSTTAALLRNSNEANETANETNELLGALVDAFGGIGVFNG